MRIILLVIAIGLGAAACTPQAPAHDKPYFAAHPDERAAQLAACDADPGRLAASPNCVNARSADADARTEHFYDAPKPASRVQAPGAL
ncbi:MAG: EexN family lipoprotein [Caulobacterales bacterium]|nr:EexN family lipoprotein [Caulobacterales bacterium]